MAEHFDDVRADAGGEGGTVLEGARDAAEGGGGDAFGTAFAVGGTGEAFVDGARKMVWNSWFSKSSANALWKRLSFCAWNSREFFAATMMASARENLTFFVVSQRGS